MNLRQLQQRNEELSILNSIAQGLNREVELKRALEATLRQTVLLLRLRTGWIWLMNPESGSVHVAAAYNLPPIFIKRPELLSGWCYCIDKYLTGKLENASNISEITCTRLKELTEGTEGLRYHASVPLFGQTDKLGVLNVLSSDSQELSEEQLQLLYTIGDMLSIAIERARLFENSKRLGVIQERNRIAREIHDTLAQSLSGISLKLETAQAFMENGNLVKAQDLINQTIGLTRRGLEEARRSVLDLRATELEDRRLPEALEKMIQEINSNGILKASFALLGSYRPTDMRTELGLYRIAREALQNVLKHARAKTFKLKVHYTKNTVRLSAIDDGRGFDIGQTTQGMGLIGINERVRLLDGRLEIKTETEKGSSILVEIPVV